jgi:hypothetical protein
MPKGPVITSSRQALAESQKLKSIWSSESHLSQRILVYCAELLEQLVDNTRKRVFGKKPRTKWQQFLSEQMKQGVTIKEAAKRWRETKLKKAS